MRSDDSWSCVTKLAATQHGAFTRRQASQFGVTARDIGRQTSLGVLDEPTPGILVFTGSPDTTLRRLWVATSKCGGGFVAAFGTAAWLHRLDGFDEPSSLEVLGQRGRRLQRVDGVSQHWGRLDPADRTMIDAIPCTGLARTICDLASVVGARPTLRAIDDFERRGCSLRWLIETAERLHRPGQSGTGVVRDLLSQRSGRAPDSWFERLVEECVGLPGLPPWTRQHEVFDDAGRFLGRLDVACPVLRLGVEAHSRRFHFGAGPASDDEQRDDRLTAAGWLLRYVGWHAVTQTPALVAATIERVARRRAQDLGISLPWAA